MTKDDIAERMERFLEESTELDNGYISKKRELIAGCFPERFNPNEMLNPDEYSNPQVEVLYKFLQNSSRAFLKQRRDEDSEGSFVNHMESGVQKEYRTEIDTLFEKAKSLLFRAY